MTPALVLLAALAGAPDPSVAVQEPAAAPAPAAETAASDSGALDRGIALLKRGRARQARVELEKAVSADPQSAAAQYYLGYALYKIAEPTKRLTKEKEEAAQHFAACFSIDPAFRPNWGKGAS